MHKHPCGCTDGDLHLCSGDYYFWTCHHSWDCECEGDNMFHSKAEADCVMCGRFEDHDGMPDSHCHELIDAGKCPKGNVTYTGPRYHP